MSKSRFALLALLCLSFVTFIACQEDEGDLPPGDGNEGFVPAGMTRLYGTVNDQAGQPVSDVELHVIYPAAPSATAQPFTPSVTFLYTTEVLTTTCDGSTPLPDGIPVLIFWDQDGDGPDATDPQPPLCDNPPDCGGGPSFTVNYNVFPINGAALLGIPGTFAVETDFSTVGDVLSPNRFYLRIYCSDGNVLWTSEPMDIPQGPSEYHVNFAPCSQCQGVPDVPHWTLDQSYPNPTTGPVSIRFGLEQSAQALLTLRQMSNGHVDTLLFGQRNPGSDTLTYDVSARANGLYEYRFSAASFNSNDYLLKNETEIAILQNSQEIDHTLSDGTYRFDTAAGVSIDRRGSNNENLGALALEQVRLIAIKPGYITADTTFAVASAESLRVDLTLHTP
jgi:hypothetical protein